MRRDRIGTYKYLVFLLQSKVRKEAASSAVDEQKRNKEATEAENAANIAKMAEHEAAVCLPSLSFQMVRSFPQEYSLYRLVQVQAIWLKG